MAVEPRTHTATATTVGAQERAGLLEREPIGRDRADAPPGVDVLDERASGGRDEEGRAEQRQRRPDDDRELAKQACELSGDAADRIEPG